jgi:hypothetical protein
MVIERGDFVHFGRRKAHLVRERDGMGRRNAAVAILDFVEMLDQEIACPRCITEQSLDFGQRLWIDRTSFDLARSLLVRGALDGTAFQLVSSRGGESAFYT